MSQFEKMMSEPRHLALTRRQIEMIVQVVQVVQERTEEYRRLLRPAADTWTELLQVLRHQQEDCFAVTYEP